MDFASSLKKEFESKGGVVVQKVIHEDSCITITYALIFPETQAPIVPIGYLEINKEDKVTYHISEVIKPKSSLILH